MQKSSVQDIIRCLRPIMERTPVEPSVQNWNAIRKQMPEDKEFMEFYMRDLSERIQWVACPRCRREWNTLTEAGICIGCQDAMQERERTEVLNGQYLQRILGKWGLEHYRFDTFLVNDDNQAAYVAFQQFNPETSSLFLFGDCGTGKTHLAGALLKACAAAGRRVKWVTPIYLARGLRGRWPEDEQDFVADLASQEVLVVDDLGVGRDAYVILQCIYEILEERRARGRGGLVITSNFSPGQLAKKYDDRLTSRLMGMCTVIQISGKDGRIEKPAGQMEINRTGD